MRKWLVVTLIGGLALIPALAFADVDIDVDITKRKDKRVSELLVKFKAAVIVAVALQLTDKAAESETLINQTNNGNFELQSERSSSSTATGISGSGILGVNQASGNMNNQANAVSVATANDPAQTRESTGSFAESQAASDQKTTRNKIWSEKASSSSTLSGVTSSGITGVNQASGSMNNQANGVSVAVSLATPGGGGIALSEADLGQFSSGNTAISFATGSSATITGVTSSGITGVNQSSGNMNNQANVVSVAVATSRSTLAGF